MAKMTLHISMVLLFNGFHTSSAYRAMGVDELKLRSELKDATPAMPNPEAPLSPVTRIVSGGQTGADRAGLDAAIAMGFPMGGWCPAGRRAADGPLPARYPLKETPSSGFTQRTRFNVRDSDGTVLLVWEHVVPGGGTAQTQKFAQELGRPCLVLDVSRNEGAAAHELARWCEEYRVRVLNVAGPTEGPKAPVYEPAKRVLVAALCPTARAAGLRCAEASVGGGADA